MGVDPIELPLRRLVSLAYYIRVRNLKEPDRDKHDRELYAPPKGLPAAKRRTIERKGFDAASEMSAFQTLAMQTAQLEGS